MASVEVPDLDDLEFEVSCSLCCSGRYTPKHGSCAKCDGRGTITTEVGKRLIEFLEKRRVILTKLEGD